MRNRRLAVAAFLLGVLGLTSFYSPANSRLSSHWFLSRLSAQSTPQVTRGPYLQMGTATSVVVRWRTNTATDSEVRYGLDPANLIFAATLPAVTINHEVELSLLQSATKYYYSVGSTTQSLAGGDSTQFFVTSPLVGMAAPTRIWVLGDSGTADAKAASVRDAYYAFAGSTFTNLWLMLGDNAYNSGTDEEYQAAVFDMYPTTLRQSVLWPTIGNHDVANTAQGTGPYYDIFTLPKDGQVGGLASGTEAYYSFDYADVHFICLDSFDVDLTAGSPMMTWVQNDVASTTQRWIIAFWHHPPYSKGSHDSDIDYELTSMRQNALPILEAAGVDLVLTGHSHSYERSFLIDGHYGLSNTFAASMKIDSGNGREGGTGAYIKSAPTTHAGAVYTVAGSSGNTSGGTLDHPAMVISLNVLGSLVLDINDGRLDAQFVDDHSAVRDSFTILKNTVPPLVISTTSLPAGGLGAPYQQTLGASGGVQPYSWSISAGTLPAGLTLNPTMGAISGTPTIAGTSAFTVRVSDSTLPSVTTTRQFSIAVAGPSTVPNVVNQTEAAATAAITGAGLTLGILNIATHASVPIGLVISQDPIAGSLAPFGTPVHLVVSIGVTVPQTAGLSQSAATALIAASPGVSVGAITTVPSTTVPAGLVISQTPVAGTNVSGGTSVALVVSSGPPTQVVVPNVVNLTQMAAVDAIAGAGLTQGTIGSAPSDWVPIGLVISQNPVAGSQVASGSAVAFVISTGSASPVVIGSQIAGTFADASGHSGQSHLFYAANSGVWWLLTLSSTADSQGGTNHLVRAYHTSGPDLAASAWTAAANSPGASATQSPNCSNCSMGGGRSLGVAYINNAPTDAVHAEVAMAFSGQNGITAHIRATVTAATIAWGTWAYYDEPAATWTTPKGVTLGVSSGKKIHSGGPILQQEVDANARVSTNADTGASWTSGFSSVSLIDNSMVHESNSMTFAALDNNRMLSVYDNGGGQAACYLCPGGVPEPNLSNLGYRRSNVNGSWPTLPAGGQASGDGKVFATDATINHNDWTLVSRDTTAIYAFRRNSAGTGLDAARYNVATNTWSAFVAPPLFGTGQSHKAGSGVFGVPVGSAIWLFVISNDTANSILYTKYGGTTWSPWASVPGTNTGTRIRNFISGHPIAGAGQVGLIWTEGTTQYDIVATGVRLTPIVPNVVNMTQSAATTAIAGAGLVVGTTSTASSATVPSGSVISQNPTPGTEVAPGSAVDLVISTGPTVVVVPNVVSQTQAAATTALTDAGLIVGTTSTASSATVPSGSVISQSPTAGTQVAAGSAVNLVISTGPPLVAVPNVVSQTQTAATAALTGAGLIVGTTSTASSATVPSGSVISQNPTAGTEVAAGSAVNLVISSGAALVAAPNVVNQTQAAATTALTDAGLIVGTTSTASSATVPSGSVISQSPTAGTQVAAGSAVNLVISTGPPLVAVPNVVSQTQTAATAALTGAGLIVGTTSTASSATVPSGSVISQNPTAGTQVAAGSAVNLVISSGPALVAAPNVVNQTRAAATTALTDAGLIVGTTSTASSATVPSGSVISQSPTAGTQVAAGSAVNLVISTGPPLVAVPNVVSQTQTAATAALTGAGLIVGTTSTASSATVPSGSVISQNPTAGTEVAAGSAVNLVISSGAALVAAPNVVNQTQAAATTAITGAGLVVGTTSTASSATVPSGSVISQNPTAGTQVASGSTVNLVISTGPIGASPTVDKVVFSDGNGRRTTSPFSTIGPNELLVAFVGSDGPVPGAQTVTVTGAGLTWALVRRANTEGGTSEVWQAMANAQLANVTVRSTQSASGYRQSLTVVAFRGASSVGASVIASASSGGPSVTLVTTRPNALVYGVGNDWDRAVARTLGSNQVMVHQNVVTAVNDTFWVQSRNASVAAAGTSTLLNSTAPTNDRWNFVSVEIVP